MTGALFASAFANYRAICFYILATGGVVAAESVYLGVSVHDALGIVPLLTLALIQLGVFFSLMAAVAFLAALGKRKSLPAAMKEFGRSALHYIQSPLFANGLAGSAMLTVLMIFFIVSKGYIYHLVSYEWDPVFAEWDRRLHFGRYPHEYLVPLVGRFWEVSKALDLAYVLWLPAISLATGYCLYCERDLRRRLQYLWAYVLTFTIVGGVFANLFASTGPLFWREFYPDVPIPDSYADLIAHLDAVNQKGKIIFYSARHWLVSWTKDDVMISFNALSAMPSLHNGTMLLLALYFRPISRIVFRVVVVLAALIFIATVYSGIHYAIDAYFAYALVAVLWLASHHIVRRFYPEAEGKRLSAG